jgi:two-component system chemotaxis response regulator CheY
MPDINGLELVGLIRSRPEYRNVPLYIITTEVTSLIKEKGMALGANGYLIKPFKPEDLQDLVYRRVQSGTHRGRGKQ